jgi:hypothetical protein
VKEHLAKNIDCIFAAPLAFLIGVARQAEAGKYQK